MSASASDRPGPIECNIRFPVDGSILFSKSYLVCKLHFVVPQCQCPPAFFLPESECKGTAFPRHDQTFSRLFFRNFSPCCVCGGYAAKPPSPHGKNKVSARFLARKSTLATPKAHAPTSDFPHKTMRNVTFSRNAGQKRLSTGRQVTPFNRTYNISTLYGYGLPRGTSMVCMG